MSNANLNLVRSYLNDLASGVTGDELAAYFTSDAIQVEFPNRLNPNGGQSDVTTILRRAEQGRRLLRRQSFEIASEVAQGNSVAVEALWTGELAIELGALKPGALMKAHFAMFFELANGKIRLQRNYDCFQPW